MGEQMTCVFDCDVRSLETNPFHADTPFGRPVIIDSGNLAAKCDGLESVVEAARAVVEIEGGAEMIPDDESGPWQDLIAALAALDGGGR